MLLVYWYHKEIGERRVFLKLCTLRTTNIISGQNVAFSNPFLVLNPKLGEISLKNFKGETS